MGKYGAIVPIGESTYEAEKWEQDRQDAIDGKPTFFRPGSATVKALIGIGGIAAGIWLLKKVL